MDEELLEPQVALRAWGLEGSGVEPISAGHINRTWRVCASSASYILQWLNPIFNPVLHKDIDAITAQLAAQGLPTPRLRRTIIGTLWHGAPDGQVWRLLSYIEGETLLVARSARTCGEAGRVLGEFHGALWDLSHEFHHVRPTVHDTARHLADLEMALEEHQDHACFPTVAPVAARILEAAAGLDLERQLPQRVVHGDPKMSNVVFDSEGRARCLVDLDTVGRMPIPFELGDAFRSWCNPRGEEVEAAFEVEFFEAGLRGYFGALGARLEEEERRAIAPCIERIALELAARFCADALRERYFNWDRVKYPSRSEHNLARARAQLALGRSANRLMGVLERVVDEVWRSVAS